MQSSLVGSEMSRQMALLLALALVLSPLAHAAGGRQPFDAPRASAPSGTQAINLAPGPAPSVPPANILFVVSARRATLAADTLTLNGVGATVSFHTTEGLVDVYSTGTFANGSAGSKFVTASGQWLHSPVAVLKATDDSGDKTSALLALAMPRFNASAQTLTFRTKILPVTAEGAHLPTAGGATHRLVEDAQNGVAAGVLTAPPVGKHLTNVALFIDQNKEALGTVAEVKWWYRTWSYSWYRTWGK